MDTSIQKAVLRALLALIVFVQATFSAAGEWKVTFPSKGMWSSWGTNNTNFATDDYGTTSTTCAGGANTGGGFWMGFWMMMVGPGGAECEGEITATVTWHPTGGNSNTDPPPAVAFIRETSVASFNGTSGQCSPGFTDNLTTTSSGPDEWGFTSTSKTAKRYTVKTNPGSSFNITCEPTASVSASGTGGSCGVSWTVEAWKVDISVGGTTKDPSDDKYKILPGQKMVASVVYGDEAPLQSMDIPMSSPPVKDTVWTVSGCVPFLDYVVAADSTSGTLTQYSSQTGANGWAYWSKPGTGTVSCTHKMKLTQSPYTEYSVSLSKNVPVSDLTTNVPVISAILPGGKYVEPTINGVTYRAVQFDYMKFTGRFNVPDFFEISGDKGEWDFAQLVLSSNRSYKRSGISYPAPTNFTGDPRLDNVFPYADGAEADGTYAQTTDAPITGAAKSFTDLEEVSLQDSFCMYWMYKPPALSGFDSKYVAISKCTWQIGLKTSAPAWGIEFLVPVVPESGPPYNTDCVIGNPAPWPEQPRWTAKVTNS